MAVPASELVATKPGDTGDDVKAWQTLLSDAGYAVDVSGVYDEKTVNATKQFQAEADILVDGIAGPETLKAASNRLKMLPTQSVIGISPKTLIMIIAAGGLAYILWKELRKKK